MKINKTIAILIAGLSIEGMSYASGAPMVDNSKNNSWYIAVNGGLNFPNNLDTSGLDASFKPGYVAGASAGCWFDSVALEVELNYLSNNIKALKVDGFALSHVGGYTNGLLAMLNAYYGFKNSSHFMPYIGLGIGSANLNHKWTSYGSLYSAHGDDTVFAAQAIAGVAYNFNQHWSVSVDYRFIGTANAEYKVSDNFGNEGSVSETYDTNMANLSVIYHF